MSKPDIDQCLTIEQTLSWIIHRDPSFPPINRTQRRQAMRELAKAIKDGKINPIPAPDPGEKTN